MAEQFKNFLVLVDELRFPWYLFADPSDGISHIRLTVLRPIRGLSESDPGFVGCGHSFSGLRLETVACR